MSDLNEMLINNSVGKVEVGRIKSLILQRSESKIKPMTELEPVLVNNPLIYRLLCA